MSVKIGPNASSASRARGVPRPGGQRPRMALAGLLVTAVLQAAEPPALPSSLFGTVSVPGGEVPAGLRTTALVAGVPVAEGETFATAEGVAYSLRVPADDPSTPAVEGGTETQAIELRIGGASAAELGAWSSGAHLRLDLTVEAGPDLAVELSDGVDEVHPGAQLEYTITSRNLSDLAATGVRLEATVPPHTDLVEAAGAFVEGGVLAWTGFDLEPGESAEHRFTVVVRTSFPQGTAAIVAAAEVRHDGSAGLDVGRDNDRATDSDTLLVPPDFAIAASDFTLDPSAPQVGEAVTLRATVRNPGFVAGEAEVVFYDGRRDRGGALSAQRVLVPAGGAVTVAADAVVGLETQLYSVIADPENEVAEVDEWNNEAERFLRTAPDLAIGADNLLLPASEPAAGESVRLRLVVRNAGRAAAEGFRVELFDGEPEHGGTPIADFPIDTLPAGGNRALDIDWTSIEGLRNLVAIADREDRVVELSETNNRIEKPLFVQPPLAADPAVTAIDLEALDHSAADLVASGTVRATIANLGTADVAGALEVRLFEDRDGDRRFGGDDRELARTAIAAGLAVGQSAEVALPVQAELEFFRPSVVAEVDPEDAWLELSEENNRAPLWAGCEETTAAALLPIVEKWRLPGIEVETAPIVVQLTDDDGDGVVDGRDVPEIVFHLEDAAGRAITARNGLDGRELWTFRSTAAHPVAGRLAHLAAGDLDGDGAAEIVGVGSKRLFALDAGGRLLWTSAAMEGAYASGWIGGAAIGDLDGDGVPEIAVGRTVLSNTGQVLAVGGGNAGQNYNFYGPLGVPVPSDLHANHSVIADVDLDGRAELLAGDTLYRWDGSQLESVWNAAVPDRLMEDGFSIPANLDSDPEAEIVYVSSGRIEVLQHTGAVFASHRWITAPSIFEEPTFWGGPPTVADLDGDGKPEILVAGSTELVAFRANLAVYWRKAIDEHSGMTGVTAFDFEGDGRPEVVYRDQAKLYVLDGRTGATRYSLAASSKTGSEYPVVADVDGDGRAELLLPANRSFSGDASTRGLHVLGGPGWSGARALWNQYSFHQTNVLDDGTAPSPELASWSAFAGYRTAEPLTAEPRRLPNLTIGWPRIGGVGEASAPVTLRVGNGGRAPVAAGALVRLLEGATSEGFERGTATTSRDLAPGQWEDVVVEWQGPSIAGTAAIARVDADDAVPECDESDNEVGIEISESLLPDWAIAVGGLTAPPTIVAGQLVPIGARIENRGNAAATPVAIWLFDGEPESGLFVAAAPTPALAAGAAGDVALVWDTVGASGSRTVTAVIDPLDEQLELDETDNRATATFELVAPELPDLAVERLAIEPATAPAGKLVTLTAELLNRGTELASPFALSFRINRAEVARPLGVAPFAPGERRTVVFTLDTLRYTGTLEVEAVVDPSAAIAEVNEANNSRKGSLVITPAGISASLRADRASYRAGEDVTLTHEVTNLESERAVDLRVTIQTAEGAVVATVVEEERELIAGSTSWTFAWPVGSTGAGTYAAVSEIAADGAVASRASAPFTVLPDRRASAELATDRSSYPADAVVLLGGTVRNDGVNASLSGLTATLRIATPAGASFPVATETLAPLDPGAAAPIGGVWSIGGADPGTYATRLEVRDADGALLAYAETPFAVEDSADTGAGLRAELAVAPDPIGAGAPLATGWTTTNGGNSALDDLRLRLRTIRLADDTIVASEELDWPLARGEQRAGTGAVDTNGFEPGEYRLTLEALLPSSSPVLASATVSVARGISVGDAAITEGDEGSSTVVVPVRLSSPAVDAIVVEWTTADGSALAGGDYLAAAGAATIPAGEVETLLALDVLGDLEPESHESFLVVLSAAAGALVADDTAVVEILDEEGCPGDSLLANGGAEEGSAAAFELPGWTATPAASFGRRYGAPVPLEGRSELATFGAASVAELVQELDLEPFAARIDGAGQELAIEGYVRAPGATPLDAGRLVVDYIDGAGGILATFDSDAVASGDWRPLVDRRWLPAGTRRARLRLSAEGAQPDALEVVFDRLRVRSLGVPVLTVDAPRVTEGNAGTTPATFELALTCAAPEPISIPYSTAPGSAAADLDYGSATGVLEIAAGATAATLAVDVLGETLDEDDEMFHLDLETPATLVRVGPRPTATILDDDGAAGLSVTGGTVLEGDDSTGQLLFEVSLAQPSGRTVRVSYATAPGTALAGADYQPTSGTLEFPPGELVRTVAVTVIGDRLDENDETVRLVLSAAENAVLDVADASGTIEDDDSSEISIGDAWAYEGDAGPAQLSFPVTLSNPSASPIEVAFATADRTAIAGTDYVETTGILELPAGSTAAVIKVPILPNNIVQPDRELRIGLSSPHGVLLADPEAIGTIRDEDGVLISIAGKSVAEGDAAIQNVQVAVTLANHNGGTPVSFDWTAVAGTATSPEDFIATSGTATVPSGTAVYNLSVQIVGDLIEEEGAERFRVVLSNPVNATLVASEATITVQDDDLWALNGVANDTVRPGCVRLTPHSGGNRGSAWRKGAKVDLHQHLDKTFRVHLGTVEPTGGDGMVFAFQNQGLTALGGARWDLGYYDPQVRPSVGIELDTVSNSGEVGYDHIHWVQALASGTLSSGPKTTILASGGEVENGQLHDLRVVWNGTHKSLFALIDGEQRVEYQNANVVSAVFGGQSSVYYGLTAGNGWPNEHFFCETAICAQTESPLLSVGPSAVLEGDSGAANLVFPVTLNCATDHEVVVEYATVDRTAFAGEDYSPTSGSLTFPPGTASRSIIVPILADELVEPDETLEAALVSASGAEIRYNSAIGTIRNDDSALSIQPVEVPEGDISTYGTLFDLRLTPAPLASASVSWQTSPGDALEGEDYVSASGIASFAAGETKKRIFLPIRGDLEREDDESFALRFSSAVNLKVPEEIPVVIVDDDRCSGYELLRNPGAQDSATSYPGWTKVSGDWNSVTGGGIAGSRRFFEGNDPSGELRQDVDLSIFAAAIDEGRQKFRLQGFVSSFNQQPADESRILFQFLDASRSQVLATIDSTSVASPNVWRRFAATRTAPIGSRWIRTRLIATRKSGANNDGYFDEISVRALDTPTLLGPAATTVTEGSSGESSASIPIRLSCAHDRPVRFTYLTQELTATAGSDYLQVFGELEYPAGVIERRIEVPIFGDTVQEGDEKLLVLLIEPQDAVLASSAVEVTIVDDELSLSVADAQASEFDGEIDFVVSLAGESEQVVSVEYRTEDLSAGSTTDFVGDSGRVDFEPGETQRSVAIAVVDDAVPEAEETFRLVLSDPINAYLADPAATGTIIDDDGYVSIEDGERLEGSGGSAPMYFEVHLSVASGGPVTVEYRTVDVSATAGLDYVEASGVLSFAPGETVQTIAVSVLGDEEVEPSELFLVELSSAVGAALLDAEASGAILDDDDCPSPNLVLNPGAEAALVAGNLPDWEEAAGDWARRTASPSPLTGSAYFAAGTAAAAELRQTLDVTRWSASVDRGAQRFVLEAFVRSGAEAVPDSGRILVEYLAEDGATVLDRFDSGALTSGAGWHPVADLRVAPAGTRWIRLRVLAVRNTGTSTDVYFDQLSVRSLGVPLLLVDPVEAVEGDADVTIVPLSIRTTCSLEVDTILRLESIGGTATPGEDYDPLAAEYVLPADGLAVEGALRVLGDDLYEGDETVRLLASAPNGVAIDGEGLATIVENEVVPKVLFASAIAGAEGTGTALVGVSYVDTPATEAHTATIDWGDGTSSNATLSPATGSQGMVGGSHVYADDGPYAIEVCVRDAAGHVGCESVAAAIVNQPPDVDDTGLVDLGTWHVEHYYAPDGPVSDWSVQSGGSSVLQRINSRPSIFSGSVSALGRTLEGTARVEPTGNWDDDFFGFVLGFGPGESTDSSADYLLLDWKQGDQSGAARGLALSRVTGIPTNTELWQHSDLSTNGSSNGVEVLARGLTRGSVGWVDNTPYRFRMEYTVKRLRVWVNDTLEFDLSGEFPDGSFGFYNYSQEYVRYSGFASFVAEGEEGDAIPIFATFSDVGKTDTHSALLDWGDGIVEAWPAPSTNGGGSVGASHVYGDDGAYAIELCVVDDDLGSGCGQFPATIRNVAPAVTASADATIEVGVTRVISLAAFVDPGRLDVHTANVDWGDGSSEAAVVDESEGRGTVSAEHSYSIPGVYTIGVCVADDDGGEGCASLQLAAEMPPPHLVASKRAIPLEPGNDGLVSPGDELLYEIEVANDGGSAATSVTFHDAAPAETTMVGGSLESSLGSIVSNDPVEVAIGGLAVGQSGTVRFRVRIDDPFSSAVSAVSNQGTVSSAELGPTVTDDPSTPEPLDPTVTAVATAPVIAASKVARIAVDADGDESASPGDELEFEIVVANTGRSAASSVELRDQVPEHTTLVGGSVATSQGSVVTEDPIEIVLGDLPAGGSVTVRFRVRIDSPVPAGVREISNQGLVTSAELPVVPTDDPEVGGDADPTVVTIVAAPRLVVEKTATLASDDDGDGTVSPGDVLEYRVLVRNVGNTSATEVVLRDPVPADTVLEPGSVLSSHGAVTSEEPVEVELGEIAGGAEAVVRFQVRIDLPIAAGVREVVNQATVTCAELAETASDDPAVGGDADPTVTPVVAAPLLRVEKTAFLFDDVGLDGAASPGDALVYRIVVRNEGNTAATEVALDDAPDSELAVEPGSLQTSQGAIVSEAPIGVALGELPAGGEAVVSLVARIAAPFPAARPGVANQATVSSFELAPVASDDPATEPVGDPTATDVFIVPELSLLDAVAPESAGELAFRVLLAEPSNRAVTLALATGDGTATAGADYLAFAGEVGIPAGAVEVLVRVPVLDDPLDEEDEQLGIAVVEVAGAIAARGFAVGTIVDDDLPPVVSIADASVIEGDTGGALLRFAVALDAPSGRATAVDYATGDGSATAPADYAPAAGTLSLPPGATAAEIVVEVAGDGSDEIDETLLVRLADPVHLHLGDAEAVGTIVDDDPARISIADASAVEGNAGASPLSFAVTLVEPAALPVTVGYSTGDTAGDASAIAGLDYTPASGTLAIAAGASAAMIAVDVLGDLLHEGDETLRLVLTEPANAVLVDAEGVGTILDDDPPPAVSIADAGVAEGDEGTTELSFPVSLSAPSGLAAELSYSTTPGTASAGADFLGFQGHLTIPAGATAAQVRIDVVGDLSDELDETFTVGLANPLRATLERATATGTILDDDLAQVTVADVELVEGDDGTAPALFAIALAEPAAEAVTLDYVTEQDTATEELDYLGASGTVAIAAGESAASVAVEVVGDTWFEEDERFLLRLSNPTAAELVDAEAIATIRNDEGCAGANLLANGGAEIVLGDGSIASWSPVSGSWRPRFGNPTAAAGKAYFDGGDEPLAELAQAASLEPFGHWLGNGGGALLAVAAVRRSPDGAGAEVWVDLYDLADALVASVPVGAATTAEAWRFLELEIPIGEEAVRAVVRLEGGGYFDAVSLRVMDVPTLVISDGWVHEPDAGSLPMPFRLTLSCPLEPTARLTVATSDGTATAGADYSPLVEQVTFPRGTVDATVSVPVLGDPLDEPAETLFLDAQGGVSVPWLVLLDGRATGTIVDDDFCQKTIGYWKEHLEEWPISSLRVGAEQIDAAAMLLHLDYTGGDLTSRLAQQLVATKLSLAKGADPAIVPTVELADAFLVSYPVGTSLSGAPRAEADRLKTLLDKFNNGCKAHE